MKYIFKDNKFYLTRPFKWFLVILSSISLFGVLLCICFHLDIKYRMIKSYLGTYKESSKVSYKVNLKENDFVTSDNIGTSDNYILKYTDFINFNFSYYYSSSNDQDVVAEYELLSIISARYKRSSDEDDEVYNKSYVVDSGVLNSNNNKIEINTNADLDVQAYNEYLSKLQDDIKTSLHGNVELVLRVTLKNGNDILDNYSSTANVQLLSDIYNVNIGDSANISKDVYSDDLELDYLYLIGLGIAGTLLFIFNIVLLKNLLKKKISLGEMEVQKYLKTYDDFIVNVENYVNYKNYEVIKITEFKEILTLATNNKTSMFFYDNKHEGIFYVIIEDKLYEFIVKYR